MKFVQLILIKYDIVKYSWAKEINLINNLNALTTYLRNYYINQIKILQWNVYALDDHRTNNDMEGYHHRIKETCIMHGIFERMRGEELMQGRRRAEIFSMIFKKFSKIAHKLLVYIFLARPANRVRKKPHQVSVALYSHYVSFQKRRCLFNSVHDALFNWPFIVDATIKE